MCSAIETGSSRQESCLDRGGRDARWASSHPQLIFSPPGPDVHLACSPCPSQADAQRTLQSSIQTQGSGETKLKEPREAHL